MWLKVTSLFIQFIIMCNQYDFVITTPMFGHFIRLVEENEFMFAVALVKINDVYPNIGRDFICSGTLVTKQDVLTSAHCTEDFRSNEISLYIGSIDLSNCRRYRVLWWVNYNNWAQSVNITPQVAVNDIANIRLRRNVHPSFIPIAISFLTNAELYNKYVDIVAWSLMRQDFDPVNLHTVTLKIIPLNDCMNRIESIYGQRFEIQEEHLCSYANPYAVMSDGNSGGAIIYSNQLVGIHRGTAPFTNEPRDPRKLNIHISIDYYRNFILAVIAPSYRFALN